MRKRRSGRGNATIEFTLVGIPLVFVLISTIEMARGMWIYHTLAYAVKEGTRYAVARGQNNPTPTTYQNVCNAIAQAGTGLLPEDLTLTFTSLSGTSPPYLANNCPSTQWPPGNNAGVIDNQPGQTISIAGYYPFISAISIFWPGAGPGMTFQPLICKGAGTLCLPAASLDVIQF
jgi:TadE-like protein